MTDQIATFGAGCFWGVEYVFLRVPGVTDVVSGYTGGVVPDATYREVCSGTTGHAEVVQLTFDPAIVSYDQLLEVFWAMHDPTQVNRQGPDRGTQYRSAIFTHSDEQREAAIASRNRAQARFSAPIATEITEFGAFYPAEDYHQRYYETTGHQPYCHAIPPTLLRDLGLVPAASKGSTIGEILCEPSHIGWHADAPQRQSDRRPSWAGTLAPSGPRTTTSPEIRTGPFAFRATLGTEGSGTSQTGSFSSARDGGSSSKQP